MKSPAARRAANLTSLLLCGVLAGVVVAAAAFPLVGSAGLTAKAASDSFEDLPGELKADPPALTSKVYTSNNQLITTFFEENRQPIPFKSMAKVMQDAIIAAEDHNFWTHGGTDPKGIVRALVSNVVGSGGTQGGSTLTQQFVKQAQYYAARSEEDRQAAIAGTGARKVQELKYAVSLEQKLSKQEIMARYLNIANFGNGNYGISAAARGYFNTSADKLTLAQAALIASTVKNPSKFNPVKGDKASAKQRRDYIIETMAGLGLVDRKAADAAMKQPIALNVQKPKRMCENGDTRYGFYCGWMLDWWKANPAFGKTPEEREENLFRGGYSITTALDPKIQAAAQEAVDARVPRTSKYALGIALVEPGTGRVKAMAVNRDYGLVAPKTTAPLLSGGHGTDGYQAGSTFKMFTMVAALEKRMPLNTTIHAPERYRSKYYGATGGCDTWCPKNASKAMTGNQTMWSAFGESANTYFVQLEERVSVKSAIQAAEKLGVVFRDKQEDQVNRAEAFKDDRAWGSFTLGVAQTTPLDMATAYATLAARGKYCAPLPLLKILDRDGKPLAFSNPTCKQVIPKEVADAATDAARCPVGDNAVGPCTHPGGGRTVARVAGGVPGQVAGKSGTTTGNHGTPTAWFVGYTPTLAGAAFVANPKKADDAVDNLQRHPASVFIDTMKVAMEGVPRKKFVAPTDALAWGVRVTVPDVEGDSVEDAKAALIEAGFTPIVDERRVGSRHPEGTVARTDPGGGSRSSKGGAVMIFVSNGTDRDDVRPGDITIPGDPGNGNRSRRGPTDLPTPD